MAKRCDVEVLLIVDSRENDLSYIQPLIESEPTKDGINFTGYRVEAVKPKGCKYSTGDLTILYRRTGTEEWLESNLSIEIKKGNDLFSSLYTAEARDRLFAEVLRAEAYGLDFYFVATHNITEISNNVNKLPLLKDKKAEIVFFKNLLALNEKLLECGFVGVLTSGSDLSFTLKRLIKHHISKHKLNYF